MVQSKSSLIIATRQSPLALYQAHQVRQLLEQHYPHLKIKVTHQQTEGDKKQHVALADIGGKDLFVKELQQKILAGQADIAVHSVKDMSVKPHQDLVLGAILPRSDHRDVLVANHYPSLAELPQQAIVGTASPRRQAQLLALRPDLQVKLVRGNVNTRLKKLDAGGYDGLIMAAAGLKRLQLEQRIASYLPSDHFISAIGQGAIGVECRVDDNHVRNLLATIHDTETSACITAERAVNVRLGGDCFTPIAAYACLQENSLHLVAMVASLDGKTQLKVSRQAQVDEAYQLGLAVADELLAQGAAELL